MQEKTNIRQPFFIATTEGYLNSDNIVAIIAADMGRKTRLRTNGGAEYSHSSLVDVPTDRMIAFFAARGYVFVDADDIRRYEPASSPDGKGPQLR